ncbi:MAG TPA: hypothetical protein VFR15_06005 [Chloroflexia bacterium]|nr:hypothetical protein [Chloroflexia bacterium]
MPHRQTARGARPIAWAFALLCGLIAILPLAGCSTQTPAGAAQAESTPTATETALPAVTAGPATEATIQATSEATATAAAEGTVVPVPPITSTATITATATPAGTPTPRPTPSGPPPENPLQLLAPFQFIIPGNMLVRSDILQLDGEGTEEALLTITESRLGLTKAITEEVGSAIGVASYDPVYREWVMSWESTQLPGVARPLPDITLYGGYNGGDLLRDGSAVLALRTTTLDGVAHLYIYRYDRQARTASPLKMVPSEGSAEEDAHFGGDLDVSMADLDDDGVYEVVVDNVAGVLTWRWDGTRFVPREAR